MLYYLDMEDKKKRCLLTWPPFITAHNLPLGIPSLVSYLKNNGIDNTEVIDLNTAYLRKIRFFWFLYLLNKRYHNLVGKIKNKNTKDIKRGSPGTIKKDNPFWKKKILYFYSYLNRKINALLNYRKVGNRKKRSIPWSLESIVKFDFGDRYINESKKIYQILNPLIKKDAFSLIGISCIYPQQLFYAFIIAKVIKMRIDKDVQIVLGGTQITKHIDHIINSEGPYDFVDFFITDDGEEPLIKLLKEFPEKDLSDIPNLYFKPRGEAESYKKSKVTFRLAPKDFLTPDFRGFDLDIHRNQIPLLASKGCFWAKCNFCTYAGMQDCTYSISSAEKTLGIIKELKKVYGVSNYRFVDDALPPRFMERLAHALSKDRLNIKWASSIILSKEFADQDFCKTLKSSGLSQVSIGLESISPRILILMNKCHKNLSESEIKVILANLKGAGIDVGLHIIFGFPTETVDEARKTVNFLIENKALYDTCMFQPFCLEDDTPVFNNPEKFAITKIHMGDKDSGERLGYRYEVARGMNQEEAKKFTYGEAAYAFKKARVSAISSEANLY
ncbi:MAG: radical SAM protein [Candidatus Omnitrophica bacterium]|nr:radical SAM protein [Candidatus Omnitrophota bacterium]